MKKTNKHDTNYYCDKAEQSGMKVRFYGNHPIIESPDRSNMLMLPTTLKSAHTESLIRRWLIKFGVLFILVITLLYFL